jgi:hypothetical protein
MDITLVIHDPLAESIRQLAAQRGVSVEALSREVVAAGLVAVAPAVDSDTQMLGLGWLAQPTTASAHPLRLRSPILARGPIPQYTIEILPTPTAGSSDAD